MTMHILFSSHICRNHLAFQHTSQIDFETTNCMIVKLRKRDRYNMVDVF